MRLTFKCSCGATFSTKAELTEHEDRMGGYLAGHEGAIIIDLDQPPTPTEGV